MALRTVCTRSLLVSALTCLSGTAFAFPAFFAYQGDRPVNHSTHVVLMKKGDDTVVSLMPDYDGDLKPFVVVIPVPDDVKAEQAKTLRRDFVDRVDQLTAPRFHEFWEMDPCEPGKPEQEWERDLKVHGSGFLGMDIGNSEVQGPAARFKPDKVLGLTVDPEFKATEQTFTLVSGGDAQNIEGWLKGKSFTAPPGTNAAVAPYVKAGMNFLVAQVDTKKVELLGSSRAVISPIRYSTKKFTNVASTLGLLNMGDKQELFIYVITPEKRYEVKNYANVIPPTNIEVDFKVKERMGEFYGALHDLMLTKQPQAFIDEYAWSTKECGQPCSNEPLMISELLTLGGDVFEEAVSKEEKNPKPPELTEDEKKAFDEIKDKKDQKSIEERLKETARRKALLARHYYVLSRMHHRYDRNNLPKDVEVGPTDPIRGGVDVPQGEKGTLPTDAKPAQGENQFQTRFVSLHPSPAVAHCDKPEHWRWGHAPITYRGLRKIWVAQDMATKNRTSHKPEAMVVTAIPSLGLAGKPQLAGGIDPEKVAAAPSASAAAGDGKKGFCTIGALGQPSPGSAAALVLGLALASLRRRSRK